MITLLDKIQLHADSFDLKTTGLDKIAGGFNARAAQKLSMNNIRKAKPQVLKSLVEPPIANGGQFIPKPGQTQIYAATPKPPTSHTLQITDQSSKSLAPHRVPSPVDYNPYMMRGRGATNGFISPIKNEVPVSQAAVTTHFTPPIKNPGSQIIKQRVGQGERMAAAPSQTLGSATPTPKDVNGPPEGWQAIYANEQKRISESAAANLTRTPESTAAVLKEVNAPVDEVAAKNQKLRESVAATPKDVNGPPEDLQDRLTMEQKRISESASAAKVKKQPTQAEISAAKETAKKDKATAKDKAREASRQDVEVDQTVRNLRRKNLEEVNAKPAPAAAPAAAQAAAQAQVPAQVPAPAAAAPKEKNETLKNIAWGTVGALGVTGVGAGAYALGKNNQ